MVNQTGMWKSFTLSSLRASLCAIGPRFREDIRSLFRCWDTLKINIAVVVSFLCVIKPTFNVFCSGACEDFGDMIVSRLRVCENVDCVGVLRFEWNIFAAGNVEGILLHELHHR